MELRHYLIGVLLCVVCAVAIAMFTGGGAGDVVIYFYGVCGGLFVLLLVFMRATDHMEKNPGCVCGRADYELNKSEFIDGQLTLRMTCRGCGRGYERTGRAFDLVDQDGVCTPYLVQARWGRWQSAADPSTATGSWTDPMEGP